MFYYKTLSIFLWVVLQVVQVLVFYNTELTNGCLINYIEANQYSNQYSVMRWLKITITYVITLVYKFYIVKLVTNLTFFLKIKKV